jgi:exonuclease III
LLKLKVSTWNLNSLFDLHSDIAVSKISILKRLLKSNIVCIQETKWDTTQHSLIADTLTNTQIFSNPGPSYETGKSLGTAILLPTYLTQLARSHTVLVEGCAEQVEITAENTSHTIVNLYLPPGKEIQTFESIQKKWNIDMKNSFMVGDQETDMIFARRAKIKGYLFKEKNLFRFVKTNIFN